MKSKSVVAPRQQRQIFRGIVVLAFGLVLGGLLTHLGEIFLPASAARTFLTTPVALSLGPFFVDLVAVSITVGPISFAVNTLTVVGIIIAALAVRSWI